MLLSSFFILDFKKYENLPDIELPENSFLCYRITDFADNKLDLFSKKLILSKSENRFCLFVTVDSNPAGTGIEFEKTIELLVPFTFLHNYLKLNSDNPLIIFEANPEETNRYMQRAKEVFKKHGYNDLESILLSDIPATATSVTREKKNILFPSGKNNNNLFSEYTNLIKEITSTDALVFFYLDDPGEIPKILGIIKQSESLIQKEFPQIYYLLKETSAMKKKEQEILLKLRLQQEQLDSIINYHLYHDSTDIRYKKQITELLSFYKNEYEILPLWYKRFGHILKVITGKRTFRSLFNDNVKKYKD